MTNETSSNVVCVQISFSHGEGIIGLTAYDRDIFVAGHTYFATNGITLTSLPHSIYPEQRQHVQIELLLSEVSYARWQQQLAERAMHHASVTVMLVDAAELDSNQSAAPHILMQARIKQVTNHDTRISIVIEPLSALLMQATFQHFSGYCRAKWGDEQCRVDRSQYRYDGSITTIYEDAGFTRFEDSSLSNLSKPNGWFNRGICQFISGKNAGLSQIVRVHQGNIIVLDRPLSFHLQLGDQFALWPGCNKTKDMCQARYHNIRHFRGEPYIPQPEQLLVG